MTYAVPPENVDPLCDLMRRRGVEATVIGEFTDDGLCVVEFEGRRIMDLDMEFLHEGNPQKILETTYTEPDHPEPEFPEPANPAETLRRMLAESVQQGVRCPPVRSRGSGRFGDQAAPWGSTRTWQATHRSPGPS